MQKQKGFTIIELIVVIAIIAVLAAIVMVSVTQYINKSKQAAIKADLSSLSKLAVDYFSQNGGYQGFCEDPKTVKIRQAISDIRKDPSYVSTPCYSDASRWCADSPYGTVNNYFLCIDSDGSFKEGVDEVDLPCSETLPLCSQNIVSQDNNQGNNPEPGQLGGSCSGDGDCSTGTCSNGICGGTGAVCYDNNGDSSFHSYGWSSTVCENGSLCGNWAGSGYVCGGDGSPCSSDSDCAVGNCGSGICGGTGADCKGNQYNCASYSCSNGSTCD